MSYKHNPNLTENAKNLRKSMTKEERRLWYEFLRYYPTRFLRQKVIDSYIVDFYCATARLAVELDGSQHYDADKTEYDDLRTKDLDRRGLKVIRIPNNEVINNFLGVCEYINSEVIKRIRE